MLLKEKREKVIQFAIKAKKEKLMPLTMGNFSLIDKSTGYICITPSGMEYQELSAEDIVVIDIDGNVIDGLRKPSTELQLHCEVYRKRPDVGGVVHTHSTFATVWACCNKEIPPIVAEVASALGGGINCAPYSCPGTAELAQITVRHLGQSNAVLLERHGLLAVGNDIAEAFANAIIAEEGAKIAFYANQLKGAKIFAEEDCTKLKKLAEEEYGQ